MLQLNGVFALKKSHDNFLTLLPHSILCYSFMVHFYTTHSLSLSLSFILSLTVYIDLLPIDALNGQSNIYLTDRSQQERERGCVCVCVCERERVRMTMATRMNIFFGLFIFMCELL